VATRLTQEHFRALLETVARGWNAGDATASAACFTEDAVYLEPPDRQFYRGRIELFEFFGGDDPPPMSMRWHHVLFDERAQIGAGEYTFEGRKRYHGIVLVELEDGRIARWREYQFESQLEWEDFVGASRFSG
jgi:ketosteroid isomerase-like protein